MTHSLTRTLLPLGAALIAAASAGTLAAQGPAPRPAYRRDLPAALVKQAKVSEADAAHTALARVPKGRIQAVELENENGVLLYSYEIKVPGRSGVEEVNVDAKTGAVRSVEHESPAKEKKEAAQEKRARHP